MRIFVGLSLLSLLLLSGLYAYDWALLRIYWTVVSSEKSPDGRITAYHLRSGNDGYGEAPYGDHVALSDSIWPMSKYSAPHVFAGYCLPLKYRWMEANKLLIDCQGKDTRIVKKSENQGSITISYEVSTRGVP
jgi:hypothetical protein